uniref:Isobutyryl-CoA dehydrogenase, mitochondrial n=1 Tax=Arcella intermedia TaxID=1963864 RepID=A0A6B2L6V9_9EUKA
MAPLAKQWDLDEHFPVDILQEAASLGFGGIYVKEDYGGSGLGKLESSLVIEALSTACVSTAAYISIHNMVAGLIDHFGTDEQKEEYLPKMCTMEHLSSYCLTEPSNGSDAGALKTKAHKEGDSYIINGEKAFISGGGVSDIYLVMARTGEEGPSGISAFIVPKGTSGLLFGKKEHKLGWNSQPTRAVVFQNVRVPAHNMLGKEGQGFKIAMRGLDGGRINIGAASVGGAEACLNSAKEYVTVRKQFGQHLSEFQNVQFKLADMATGVHSSRLMIRHAATMLDKSDASGTVSAAMAKRYATDTCYNVVNDALQLFGGYGYLKDFPIERYLRDLRVHQILEGTNEIMRLIVSRKLLSEV